jgi:hypothetical protein
MVISAAARPCRADAGRASDSLRRAVSDFTLVLKDKGMRLTRAQLEAITAFGTQKGGTLELSESRFGMVRLRDPAGREVIFRTDGQAERFD